MRSTTPTSALFAILFVLGCDQEGEPTPPGVMNFPTALALSSDEDRLYVANSNFDLRYRRGTLQSFDLNILDDAIAAGACVDPAICAYVPTTLTRTVGQTRPEPVDGLLIDEVLIGSYATDLEVVPTADPGRDRLYVPVGSDASIHHPFVASSGFECGQGALRDCAAQGGVSSRNFENLTLPTDPVSLTSFDVGELGISGNGRLINLLYRGGSLAILFDPLTGDDLVAVDVVDDMAVDQLALAYDRKRQRLLAATRAGGILTAVTPSVNPVVPTTESIRMVPSVVGTLAPVGGGSLTLHDLTYDPRSEKDLIYAVGRAPRAFLSVAGDGAFETAKAPIAIGRGVSKLRIQTLDIGGQPRAFAFASCLDDDQLEIIDIDLQKTVGVVRGLGAPYDFVIDVGRRRAYVADFLSSVVRVVSLAPLISCLERGASGMCSPVVVATVGYPQQAGVGAAL